MAKKSPHNMEMASAASGGQGSNKKLTVDEKLTSAHDLKEQGNSQYKNKSYKQAIRFYHQSLLYSRGISHASNSSLDGFMGLIGEAKPQEVVSPEVQDEVRALQMDCYNNLAACILQQEKPNYEKIVKYCDDVLEISPNNVKALYRKGVAYYHRRDYDKSHTCLTLAKKHKGQQKDPAIDKFLSLCAKAVSEEEKEMKATYKGLFDKLSADKEAESQS